MDSQRFRGYNALRSLRVGAMAIAASFKTNVAQAKKFYFEDPDIVPAKDCVEHDEVCRDVAFMHPASVHLGTSFFTCSYLFFFH